MPLSCAPADEAGLTRNLRLSEDELRQAAPRPNRNRLLVLRLERKEVLHRPGCSAYGFTGRVHIVRGLFYAYCSWAVSVTKRSEA